LPAPPPLATVSFLALRFDAAAADADGWGDALLEAGALSVDVADPLAGTAGESPLFGEPGAPPAARWPLCRLTALLPAAADADAVLRAAATALGRPLPPHETQPVADQDWVRATQAQFGPIEITPALWIVPSWCEPVEPRALNLVLDPGLAFGTGSHPTTRLCLAWLAAELRRGESVLDYGCGSGILAIAAARLGAGRVVGTDVDPQAIVASRDNARRNGVSATFVVPDELVGVAPADFDVVVANILANPLILLAPALAARTRRGGRIVLSGVLETQAGEVAAAYAPWFTLAVWRQEDSWVALAGTRRDDAPAA
jgi:ribosomal protein L11 methyltransferase